MIHVDPAPEPAGFDESVRRPGLDALAELVGDKPSRRRPGPKRKPIAQRREDIPSREFPQFWTEVRRDLSVAHRGICAYSAMRIAKGHPCGTVDHFIPVSASWQGAYEWSNFRLACAEANTWKGVHLLPFDPFALPDHLCALEFVFLQVIPGEAAQGEDVARVNHMINTQLRLNDRIFLQAREEYFEDYSAGRTDLGFLERNAPFMAMELRRQGRLLRGDV